MNQVLKTIKMFSGGKFIRSESGRVFEFYQPSKSSTKKTIWANVCECSKKDIRNTVELANKSFGGWSERTPYNRGQILYRVAEIFQAREPEFLQLATKLGGLKKSIAKAEFEKCINTIVFYAGFTDKYSQLLSSVNPVQGNFLNYTNLFPLGLVAIQSKKTFSCNEIIDKLCAVICSGNVAIQFLNKKNSFICAFLSEIFATSDIPPGVINILTHSGDEVLKHASAHMEIPGLLLTSDCSKEIKVVCQENGADHLKRINCLTKNQVDSLQLVSMFTESKTVWASTGI